VKSKTPVPDSVAPLNPQPASMQSSPTVASDASIALDWQAFCTLDTQSKVFGVKASAALILSGVELARLHENYAISAGNPNFRTRAGIGETWPEIVKQNGGISDDTAARRIKLAEAAAAQLPILREVLSGEADPRLLSDAKKEALNKGLRVLTDGKTQRQLMWDLGLGPKPKPQAGFRPKAEMLQAWLAKQHPERKGAAYDDLPAEVQKAFKKQYRAPGLTRDQESEMKREWWRQNALGLSEQLLKKSYRELDARDREWIALAYYDGWKALSPSAKATADESAADQPKTTPSTPSTNQNNDPAEKAGRDSVEA
jgi:hypothetical protein